MPRRRIETTRFDEMRMIPRAQMAQYFFEPRLATAERTQPTDAKMQKLGLAGIRTRIPPQGP